MKVGRILLEHTSIRKYCEIKNSDGKYRYNKVSISIDTEGPVIDKYRYFPFIF